MSRPKLHIRTVSHTLSPKLAEKLREFAFRQRVSESSIIEYALFRLFEDVPDIALSDELKAWGASLRRRSNQAEGGD